MKQVSSEDNFIFLLVALLTLLFTVAVVEQFFQGGQLLVVSAIILCLAFSILGVKRQAIYTKSWFGVLLTLFLVTYVISILTNLNLSLLTIALVIVFLMHYMISAFKQVLFTGQVGSNQIIGSICIYLMIGLVWSFVYLFLLESFNGGFSGLENQHWLDNLSSVIYYSFITLTTVGYGEITPTLPITRFFAYMQSLTGSFYLAILVASLVSTGLEQRKRKVN
ncbi:potassium channel family protein [Vibrio ulleungensis]|uniref:Two pore domain potassium channel family protein n=1 Tax=Vibrio ulleungensis TaxID=2807619 RepID=A0ABS2HIR2_9VIBR|nr:potassium channel family protein [Vibrio ulleungensis]MBM7036904.1 two pore domain potassium channel family protein [Vibrio ulleungensis]